MVILTVIQLEQLSDFDLTLHFVSYFITDSTDKFLHFLVLLVMSTDGPN